MGIGYWEMGTGNREEKEAFGRRHKADCRKQGFGSQENISYLSIYIYPY
jgi:hypothetical protein